MPQTALETGGVWQNLYPQNKYFPSACHVPGKGGEAGNTAVKENKITTIPGEPTFFWES